MNYKILQNDILTLELVISSEKRQFYYYKIYDNNFEYVGNCGIRFNADKYLGNIEYEIFPGFNGHNYAAIASKLLAKIAIEKGIKDLKITANPNNIASLKTIEKLGAKFIICKKVPLCHQLHKENKKVNIYNWNLEGENYDRYKIDKRK